MDKVMVNVMIQIDASHLMSDTSSLVEMYINGHMETQLFEATQTYTGIVPIPYDEAHIVLVRKYQVASTTDAQVKEGNIFSKIVKMVAGFLFRFLLVYAPVEPFNCIYEAEECFHLSNLKTGSAITFVCELDSSSRCPKFESQSDSCNVVSRQKNYTVSTEEIKAHYGEEKKFIKLLGFGSSILLFLLMILSLTADNTITALFLGIIVALIVGCSLFSLINLHKEYLKYSQVAEQINKLY